MSIKVIGAGFGRTGTASLRTALEKLGFNKCYHMHEILVDQSRAKSWYKASQGKDVNWDRVFDGYQAMLDWPSCSFYKNLVEKYPEAMVILTVRDPEEWYKSVSETVYPLSNSFSKWHAWFSPTARIMKGMLFKIIWEGTFHGKFEDKEYAKTIFNRHIEEVKRTVSEEKLLIYKVTEGWKPLCEFLKVDEPEEPFPRVNGLEEFHIKGNEILSLFSDIYSQELGSKIIFFVLILWFLWFLSKIWG